MSATIDPDVIRFVHDDVWYQNATVLFEKGRMMEFWPNVMHSREEKVNAIVRFIVYATVLTYLVSKKSRYIAMGLAAVVAISVAHALGPKGPKPLPMVQPRNLRRPTRENPMGNRVSLQELDDRPLDDSHEAEEARAALFRQGLFMNLDDAWSKKNSERQFISMPDNDQGAFANYLYGDMKHAKDMNHLWTKTTNVT
jgi:hypothetical protein